ncbi:hypothetical protein R84B8_00431 [Treponema sp. R8-4-B8]
MPFYVKDQGDKFSRTCCENLKVDGEYLSCSKYNRLLDKMKDIGGTNVFKKDGYMCLNYKDLNRFCPLEKEEKEKAERESREQVRKAKEIAEREAAERAAAEREAAKRLAAEKERIEKLRKAAEQGDAEAQYDLGKIYQHGGYAGVPKDDAKALEWYCKAAEQGYAYAQYESGIIYYEDKNKKIKKKGKQLIRKAAAQGVKEAEDLLKREKDKKAKETSASVAMVIIGFLVTALIIAVYHFRFIFGEDYIVLVQGTVTILFGIAGVIVGFSLGYGNSGFLFALFGALLGGVIGVGLVGYLLVGWLFYFFAKIDILWIIINIVILILSIKILKKYYGRKSRASVATAIIGLLVAVLIYSIIINVTQMGILKSQSTQSVETQLVATQKLPAPVGFVWINGGTFTMGSPISEKRRNSDEVKHQVTISSFYMGKHEVTQKEYKDVMGTNPSNFQEDYLPVWSVTWFNAVEYCNRLSKREGLIPAYIINGTNVEWNQNATGYRLPTEAEWEYACRAGTTTPFNTGKNITTEQANYNGLAPYNKKYKGENRKKATPVGSFAPNSWGLYDMHGNVIEWCWDWGGDYLSLAQTNPTGAVYGNDRVARGGGWKSVGSSIRSASRWFFKPSIGVESVGFRLARNLNP